MCNSTITKCPQYNGTSTYTCLRSIVSESGKIKKDFGLSYTVHNCQYGHFASTGSSTGDKFEVELISYYYIFQTCFSKKILSWYLQKYVLRETIFVNLTHWGKTLV